VESAVLFLARNLILGSLKLMVKLKAMSLVEAIGARAIGARMDITM